MTHAGNNGEKLEGETEGKQVQGKAGREGGREEERLVGVMEGDGEGEVSGRF